MVNQANLTVSPVSQRDFETQFDLLNISILFFSFILLCWQMRFKRNWILGWNNKSYYLKNLIFFYVYFREISKRGGFSDLACPTEEKNIGLGKQCLKLATTASSFNQAEESCLNHLGFVQPPVDLYQNTILR